MITMTIPEAGIGRFFSRYGQVPEGISSDA
jgi:hypothetical protein